MKKEELLMPRYKVIADYPNNKKAIGNIILMDKLDPVEGAYTSDGYMMESFYQDYPHLFKKLEWWEDRKPEDMPSYMKLDPEKTEDYLIDPKKIFKVKEWSYCFFKTPDGDFINNENMDFIPATLEEYNAYLKKYYDIHSKQTP